jgi:hypothetical protein
MLTRYFALIAGIIFFAFGLLGFLPSMLQAPLPGDPNLIIEEGYGYLFGLFPVNILHNLLHVMIGILGISASHAYLSASTLARTLMIFFGSLAVMGIIPQLDTLFGFFPLFSHGIWFHALTAIAAGYFGYLAPSEEALYI